MKFLDLFAGIGGFRLGMEMAGHECVGYVEIDKFARKSYEAIHDTEGEWTAYDITSVTNDDLRQLRDKRGRIDIICGGFPCQAFSIAGKRGGFHDTRGTLFFEIVRIANILRPRYLFLENVKGLLNHDNGNTFETILRTLDELGYDAEWEVLNSKDFGVPQNRERVFIIGHLRRERTRKVFPIGRTDRATDLPIRQVAQLDTPTRKNSNRFRTYDPEGIAACLSTMGGGGLEPHISVKGCSTRTRSYRGQKATLIKVKEATSKGYAEAEPGDSINIQYPDSKTRRGRVGKQIANTLEASSINQGVLLDNIRIRKLTPRECWRLQGFPDWTFDKAREVNSDSQLYKQAGNSVTVNVIYEIAKRL